MSLVTIPLLLLLLLFIYIRLMRTMFHETSMSPAVRVVGLVVFGGGGGGGGGDDGDFGSAETVSARVADDRTASHRHERRHCPARHSLADSMMTVCPRQHLTTR